MLRNCNMSILPLLPSNSCAARRLTPTRCNSSGRMLSVPAYAAAVRRVDHMHLHHAYAWPICRSRTVDMNLGARIHTRPEISVRGRIPRHSCAFRSRRPRGGATLVHFIDIVRAHASRDPELIMNCDVRICIRLVDRMYVCKEPTGFLDLLDLEPALGRGVRLILMCTRAIACRARAVVM